MNRRIAKKIYESAGRWSDRQRETADRIWERWTQQHPHRSVIGDPAREAVFWRNSHRRQRDIDLRWRRNRPHFTWWGFILEERERAERAAQPPKPMRMRLPSGEVIECEEWLHWPLFDQPDALALHEVTT
jgi:hypothetical protein